MISDYSPNDDRVIAGRPEFIHSLEAFLAQHSQREKSR
jgi:hypothetical protein